MARKLIKLGELSGCGGTTFTLLTTMFVVQNSSNVIEGYPSNIRFKSGGSFSNCTRTSDTTLSLTNPSSDTTFTCEVEYQAADDGWDWHSFIFTGVLYSSLGGYNITTTKVNNKIGAGTNNVGLLCTSPNVNEMSYNFPNGLSPYKLGDFRYYTHGVTKGARVGYYARIGNSLEDQVPWPESYDIVVTGSKVFNPEDGKPYDAVKLAISPGADGDTKNISGSQSYGIYHVISDTNSGWNETIETYTVKIRHYNGTSWVDGDTVTFDIYLAGRPYSINYTTPVKDPVDTVSIDITAIDCAINNVSIKFSVQASEGWLYDLHNPTINFDSTTLSVTSGNVIPSGAAWKLESQYNGTWYLEAQGNLP